MANDLYMIFVLIDVSLFPKINTLTYKVNSIPFKYFGNKNVHFANPYSINTILHNGKVLEEILNNTKM